MWPGGSGSRFRLSMASATSRRSFGGTRASSALALFRKSIRYSGRFPFSEPKLPLQLLPRHRLLVPIGPQRIYRGAQVQPVLYLLEDFQVGRRDHRDRLAGIPPPANKNPLVAVRDPAKYVREVVPHLSRAHHGTLRLSHRRGCVPPYSLSRRARCRHDRSSLPVHTKTPSRTFRLIGF